MSVWEMPVLKMPVQGKTNWKVIVWKMSDRKGHFRKCNKKCYFVKKPAWKTKFGQMSFWKNIILEKCHFGKMSFWKNVILEKYHFGKISFWKNIILEKCHFGKLSLDKCHFGKMLL